MPPRTMPRPALIRLLLFASGFSGLAYEVVWMRMLSSVIGSTVFSVTTVLCVFMAGLAAGSIYFGRRADAWAPGPALRAYGLMQLGIAAFAFLAPLLLDAASAGYVGFYRSVRPSFGLLMAVRVAVSALILFPPAFLMGGTLPAICQHAARAAATFGRDAGALYAANTAGGLAGCAAAGFAFIEAVGLRGTSYYAAFISAVAGAIAWLASQGHMHGTDDVGLEDALLRRQSGQAEGPYGPTTRATLAPGRAAALAAVAAGVSGFTAMGYQVLWTRAYLFFMGTTVYAFTIIVMTFLLGIALGSHLLARLGDRRGRPGLLLGIAQVGVGLWACASCPTMCAVFRVRAQAAVLFEGTSLAPVSDGLLAAAAGMLAPTVLMGASLPLAMAWYRQWSGATGRSVGVVAGVNAVGSALGPVMAGFILIPALGVDRGIMVFAGLNVAAGVAVVLAHRPKAVGIACAAAGIAAISLTAGATPFLKYAESRALGKVIEIDEGPDGTITVSQHDGHPLLTIDGTPMAASDRGMRWRGHLPMVLHPHARRVLVVGFGTGTTAGTVAAHYPDARVDVVELSETVARAGRHFKAGNHDVLHHPRVRIIVEDARNYVAATDQQYDVIVVDAPHPFAAHASALFGREFYQACGQRLAEGGIFLQWIPLYLEPAAELKAMVRTFFEVFPKCTMWGGDDINMVAVRGPLRLSMRQIAQRIAQPGFQRDLRGKDMADAAAFLAEAFLMDAAGVRRWVGEGPIVTDDFPFIEFSIPKALRSPGPASRPITWQEIADHRTAATPYLVP